jgi:hypothetical protein
MAGTFGSTAHIADIKKNVLNVVFGLSAKIWIAGYHHYLNIELESQFTDIGNSEVK